MRDVTHQKEAEIQLKLASEGDRILGNIALDIRQSLDLGQILKSTVVDVRQFLGVEQVFITRFDQKKKCSVIVESVVPPFPSLKQADIGIGFYEQLSEVFCETPICIIDDTTSKSRETYFYRLMKQYEGKVGLAVPITVNGGLFGVLVAHQCVNPRPWTEFEQQLLLRLVTQVAIAIQQSELYYQIRCLNDSLEEQISNQDLTLEKRNSELKKIKQLQNFLFYALTREF